MTKPVILTGLRANNDLHIGNYFGALLPLVRMIQSNTDTYQVNLFVPDLHSFTTPIDHAQLQDQITHNLKLFVAAGLPLDSPDINIYRQSYVPAHSELTWILDCFTGMGEMNRMTQFKDKSATLSEDRISVGLFNYPVLMAADILLYDTSYVPVGDDQTQHLEFTRDIAQRFNTRFEEEIFVTPAPVARQHEFFGKKQGLRIKDLVDPTKKMSKSDASGKGVIFLTDSPEQARKKIMSATTDSFGEVQYDPAERPGISNLLEMLAMLRGEELQVVIDQYSRETAYGTFKTAVADQVVAFLEEFQTRFSAVSEQAIADKLTTSEEKMNVIANRTLLRAQKAVGLR